MIYLRDIRYFLTLEGRGVFAEERQEDIPPLVLAILEYLRYGPKSRSGIIKEFLSEYPSGNEGLVEWTLGQLVQDGYIDFEVEDE